MFADHVAGWRIYHDPFAPVTGRWRAVRFGVSMCAGTCEAITAMVRAKEAEYAKKLSA